MICKILWGKITRLFFIKATSLKLLHDINFNPFRIHSETTAETMLAHKWNYYFGPPTLQGYRVNLQIQINFNDIYRKYIPSILTSLSVLFTFALYQTCINHPQNNLSYQLLINNDLQLGTSSTAYAFHKPYQGALYH